MESFYGGRNGSPFIIVKRYDCIDLNSDIRYEHKSFQIYRIENSDTHEIEDYYVVTKSIVDGSSSNQDYNFVTINNIESNDTSNLIMKDTELNGESVNIGYFELNGILNEFHKLSEKKELPYKQITYAKRKLAVESDTQTNEPKRYYNSQKQESYYKYYYIGGNFIEKTTANEDDYAWIEVYYDGNEVLTIDSEGNETYHNLPLLELQGMLQDFKQGAQTTSEVNYGEYVIIDTIANGGNPGDPDNGKIFRRGMDHTDVTALPPNTYYGGEYIGQVIGPKGEFTSFDFGKYSSVIEKTGVRTGEYSLSVSKDATETSYVYVDPAKTMKSEETIDAIKQRYPIAKIEENTDLVDGKTNSNIKYAWVSMKDAYGNVEGAMIGFQIPYLVLEYESRSVNPYYHYSDKTVDFINKDLAIRIDDRTNPFYEKWHLSIPKGIKGDTFSNLRIDKLSSIPAGRDVVSPKTNDVNEKSSGGDHLLIDLYKYDRPQTEDITTYDLGQYNIINDVDVNNEGTLTVQYSHDKDKVFKNKIKWVSSISFYSQTGSINGTQIPAGSIVITYNTGEKEIKNNVFRTIDDVKINSFKDSTLMPGSGNQKINILYNINNVDGLINEDIGEPLNYIIESLVTTTGFEGVPADHLFIYFSDPILRSRIKSNYEYPSNIYKMCREKQSQQYYVIHNDEIITDTVINSENGASSSVTFRIIKDENGVETNRIQLDSIENVIWDEWYDAGSVKGSTNNLRIVKTVDSETDLPSNGPNPDGAYAKINTDENGAIISTDVYMYNYDNGTWFLATNISKDIQEKQVAILSNENKPAIAIDGLYFVEEKAFYGYNF